MPSGLTAKLNQGEQSFQEFCFGCARQFGALIAMRDDPMDAPIPDEFKPSDFYSKRVESLKTEIQAIEGMTPQALFEMFNKEVVQRGIEIESRKKETESIRARYEAMLEKVNAWTPPTPDHIALKELMATQLKDSIKWDCQSFAESVEPIAAENLQTLKVQRIATLKKDLAYYEEEHRKEIERVSSRNVWIKALRESLQNVK